MVGLAKARATAYTQKDFTCSIWAGLGEDPRMCPTRGDRIRVRGLCGPLREPGAPQLRCLFWREKRFFCDSTAGAFLELEAPGTADSPDSQHRMIAILTRSSSRANGEAHTRRQNAPGHASSCKVDARCGSAAGVIRSGTMKPGFA